jgi:hypothetical protein
MTATAPDLPARLLDEYRRRLTQISGASAAGIDELMGAVDRGADGDAGLVESVEAMGLPGLLAARAEAARLVEDDGVTYGYGAAGRPTRVVIDPLLPIMDLRVGRGRGSAAQRARPGMPPAICMARARVGSAARHSGAGARRLSSGR